MDKKGLSMSTFESLVSVAQSVELVKARVSKRKALAPAELRPRTLAVQLDDNPTKELDAVMLGDALVGYGKGMSLNNMAIIENVMTMAIMEANYKVPNGKNTQPWYSEFVGCLRDLGCFIADDGYTQYSSSSLRVDMDYVIKDIVKGILDGVKASLPAASVLGAVIDTTVGGLKDDTKTLNLFNGEVKIPEGARLSVIPCEELENGILVASSASVKQTGSSHNGGVLFVNWQSSALEIFRGKSFITFNPARYEEYRSDIEEYLGAHRKEVLKQRFSRRSTA